MSSFRPNVLEYPPTLRFWMDRWSRDQPPPGSLFQRPREAERRHEGTRLMLHKPIRVCLNEWENRFEFSLQSIYGLFGWTETPCWISSSVSTTVCFGFILKIFPVLDAIFDFCLSKQSIDALQRNIKPILLLVSVNANFEFVINPRGGANMYWRLHFVIH